MRSFFNCTKATQHIDPASHTQPSGGVQAQAAPGPMTRVAVENMLTKYVRDGLPTEDRMEAKKRMLACFDELQPPAEGLAADQQTLLLEQHARVKLNLRNLQLKTLPENLGFLKDVGFVDLSDNELEALPSSIGDLSNIRELEVKSNRLRNLPESLGNLTKMTDLNLSGNQLETLPSTIGNLSCLLCFNVDTNRLQSLPDSIVNLSSLLWLNVAWNRLQGLPDSIGNLTCLSDFYVDFNQFQSLPDSIGNLPKLSTLSARCNQLEGLPEWIGTLSNLRELDLRQNRIQILPESIGNLSQLSRLNITNNSLRSLPGTIGQLAELRVLKLGCNGLDTASAYYDVSHTIGRTEYREQHTNRLETLPESIGNLQKLEVLHLSSNPLRELPQSLVHLPTSCRVGLQHTGLPQAVREQLQNAIVVHNAQNPEQGPRIEFDMAQHNRAVHVISLGHEIASWRQQASNYSSVETATPSTEQPQAFQAALNKLSNIEATALSGQLARMRVTAHYKAAPQDLIQRVNAFLDYVEQVPDVLKTCAAIAAEGTETCDDRIALAFIQLEEAVVHHRSLNEPSLAKLVETAGGLHKSQLLQAIAQQKVSTLVGFVDPTEIILKYVVNLSKEFNLPSQLDDMIFHNCARQVSNADIRHARREIKKQATEKNLNTFLASWHPWQQALSKQYPAEYAQVQAEVKKQQEKMHEKMDKLTDRLATTKANQGEFSTQYLDLLAQSNALKADYRNIETDLFAQLTEQARQQIGSNGPALL